MDDTYEAPKDGWVCFHCGLRCIDERSAEIHFGRTPNSIAGCLLKPEKNILRELRKAENDRDQWQRRALNAEDELQGVMLQQTKGERE